MKKTKEVIFLGQKKKLHVLEHYQKKIKRKASFCSTNSLLEYKIRLAGNQFDVRFFSGHGASYQREPSWI